ncbi:MAG: hypothetical protein V4661_06840 [Pseudomonadota bacterium]
MIALELASLPFVFFVVGSGLGAPNLQKAHYVIGLLAIFLPLLTAGILTIAWRWLERYRQFYPFVALVLVIGWSAFFLLVKKPSVLEVFISYVFWHIALYAWAMSVLSS